MSSTISPFSTESLQNPYPFYSWLRKNSPVYKVPETGHYMVASHKLIEEVCKKPEIFSSRLSSVLRKSEDGELHLVELGLDSPEQGVVLGAEDGDAHQRQRTLLGRCFIPEVRRLSPLIYECARTSIRDLETDADKDLIKGFAKRMPQTVIASILAISLSEMEMLDKATNAAMIIIGGVSTDEMLLTEGMHINRLHEFLAVHFDQYDAAKGISAVMNGFKSAIDAGHLSREEAIGILFQLVIGGSETSVSLISTMLYVLAGDEELLLNIKNDPELISPFIEEALRLESPAQGNYRRCIADTVLDGTEIPKGATLTLLWGSANRDESVFEKADQFILGRHNFNAHLAFGKGIHFCLGATLARMEAKIALEELFSSGKKLVLTEGSAEYHESLFIRCLKQMPVQFA